MGPMQDWNRDALVALTARLKENVIMKHGLSDKLVSVAGGFMVGAEAQAVLSKQTNADQMGELIYILRGKSDADFETFCAMLKAVGYEVWANQLEKEAEEFKQKSGKIHALYSYSYYLARIHRDSFMYIQLIYSIE